MPDPVAPALIDERPTRVRWLVVGLTAVLAIVIYLHRSATSPTRSRILQEFIAAGYEIDDLGMGRIQAAFSWGYLFQVIGSLAGTRFGNRYAMTTFALGTSLAVLTAGLARSPAMLWCSLFAIGVSQAGIIPCVSQMFKDWIPLPQRGFASGVFTGSMATGSALGALCTGFLIEYLPWQAIFFIHAGLGLAWACLFGWWFRNLPGQHAWVNPAEESLIRAAQPTGDAGASSAGWPVWRGMLTCWSQWANCAQQFFRNFFFFFFISGCPSFLEYAYGISPRTAGMLTAIPLTTVIFGTLIGGQVLDSVYRVTQNKYLSRSGLACAGHLLCGAMLGSAAWAPNVYLAVLVVGIGIFFFGVSSPCTWAATMDLAGKHTSLFMSVTNMVGVFAGIICPSVVGQMFVAAKAGEISWNRIFFLFAGINLCAALCWACINSSRPAKLPE